MELFDAIKGRRSVRKFKPDPVPKEVLEGILELALWAPSGMNRQESYFIVVQGEKKEELRKIFSDAFNDMKPTLEKVFAEKPKIVEGMRVFFETYGGAPVFIFAYAGKMPNGGWDTNSSAVAVQNLLLAAHEAGLGSTWTDGVLRKEKEINEALGIEDRKLICVLPVGYPDETPRVPPRREDRIEWIGF
ncbi:MAG: nitroreductase family protein [Deltaproteobacteria bacterium]|nr:nitroreductase family protein [Deltaproteobacteria bacterium]MBW2051921.1 nitroreductase family protein [Deltaproteobacteria bacterium]MBW2140328.1 nitroreductase family protein [Deltaproteobacteria bacterium]MBW2324135.1 nitroreductase family protein [Deltaproteobacteria bacterium]